MKLAMRCDGYTRDEIWPEQKKCPDRRLKKALLNDRPFLFFGIGSARKTITKNKERVVTMPKASFWLRSVKMVPEKSEDNLIDRKFLLAGRLFEKSRMERVIKKPAANNSNVLRTYTNDIAGNSSAVICLEKCTKKDDVGRRL